MEKAHRLISEKLENAGFMEHAPDDLIARERSKQAEFAESVATLREQVTELG